jgi:tetratricopeptide (TPR) repeat protein
MSEYKTALNSAWDMIHSGNYNGAISEINEILSETPDDIDAYYGLGLAQRNLGQEAEAIKAFQKALDISVDLLHKIREQYGVDETRSSLETTEDDRHMMLQRMLSQRLSELGVG